MLPAATKIGCFFLEGFKLDTNQASEAPSNNILMAKLWDGELDPFYYSTNASLKNAFTLQLMMALFGERKPKPDNNGSSTIDVIVMLQKLSEVRGWFLFDELMKHNILSSLQSICASTKQVDMTGNDVVFLILDVETTGLSDKD
eukprot:CCRYP_008556-RA/>CCRYP_008556-RA protein AED:0.90 eAED:0.88 QI:0/0/0/0.5/0/0/2/0/143